MATRPQPSIGREQHRDMDCESYDDCLMVAARERWDGFDCRKCPQMGNPTILKLMRGPEARKRRPAAEHSGKPTAEEEAEAMAVLAALAKAESVHGGPVAPRYVGAFLGIGGRAANTLLAQLEARGMARRYSNGREGWSLK